MVEHLVGRYRIAERRACRVLRLPRATYRYRSCLDPRTELRYAHRKIRVPLNREGWDISKIVGVPAAQGRGLLLRRMKPAGKRKAVRHGREKLTTTAPNQAWSMDFVADQLQKGNRFPPP